MFPTLTSNNAHAGRTWQSNGQRLTQLRGDAVYAPAGEKGHAVHSAFFEALFHGQENSGHAKGGLPVRVRHLHLSSTALGHTRREIEVCFFSCLAKHTHVEREAVQAAPSFLRYHAAGRQGTNKQPNTCKPETLPLADCDRLPTATLRALKDKHPEHPSMADSKSWQKRRKTARGNGRLDPQTDTAKPWDAVRRFAYLNRQQGAHGRPRTLGFAHGKDGLVSVDHHREGRADHCLAGDCPG